MQSTSPNATSKILLATALAIIPARIDRRDEHAISDFSSDLDAALRDLEQASKGRELAVEKAKKLQQNLNGHSWWGAFKASVSGETDKGLANMVEHLGASLGLTLSALRVTLKVQTEKNKLLRGFSNALVEKIGRIQSDTHTLDNNQKQVALAFLGELQAQIDEQIRQQDLVDNHESKLQEIEQLCQRYEDRDATLSGRIEKLEAEAIDLRITLMKLEAAAAQVTALKPRLIAMEAESQRSRSSRAVILRNLLPVGATLVSIVALFLSLSA